MFITICIKDDVYDVGHYNKDGEFEKAPYAKTLGCEMNGLNYYSHVLDDLYTGAMAALYANFLNGGMTVEMLREEFSKLR